MSGAAQIISGYMNQQVGEAAAHNAANTQSSFLTGGLNNAQIIYDQATGKYEPYIQAGTQAENELAAEMGPTGQLGRQFTLADFYQDPAYKFNLQQGMNAISNSNSARGGALSGATQKALQDYTLQQASNEFGNARNYFTQNQQQNYGELSGIAGTGLGALNAQSNLGENFSRLYLGGMGDIGTSQASGILGAARAEEQGNTQMAQGMASLGTMGLGTIGS